MPVGHITQLNLRASSNLILGKATVADYRLYERKIRPTAAVN